MNNKKEFQRDAFIKKIYNASRKNKDIFFLSADFGAPALDDFRFKLSRQFLHLGICEQNMIDFACGMALEGKKVFAYAMAPFLSLRCLEQHKTATCLMNLDVTSIVTGIGLSYANSGPTHYSTEDFACLRALPNCYIFTASDPLSAAEIAKKTLSLNKPKFIRLDRKASQNFKLKIEKKDIDRGFRYLIKSSSNRLLLLGHGTILERAINAINQLSPKIRKNISLIDLIQSKPFPKQLQSQIKKFKNIITIDEQTKPGGLGSLIRENNPRLTYLKEMCLSDEFIFENLGRDKLLDKYGLSINLIKKNIQKIYK